MSMRLLKSATAYSWLNYIRFGSESEDDMEAVLYEIDVALDGEVVDAALAHDGAGASLFPLVFQALRRARRHPPARRPDPPPYRPRESPQ